MSQTTVLRQLLAIGALALLWASPAAAHGLLVSIRGDGRFVEGRVYYSDGTVGAGQYAELTDLSDPASKARSGTTDAKGDFRFEGVPGHRYRFLTQGEEGHKTEMLITLAPGAKGSFIDRDAAKPGFRAPPAWLVIGGLLALLSIPAFLLRKRKDDET